MTASYLVKSSVVKPKILIMQKKFLAALALVVGQMFFASTNLSACGFTFDIVENKKEHYSSGDKFVVSIMIKNTCRGCNTDINSTIFELNGLKNINATPWRQVIEGVFERRFTLEVDGKGKAKYSFDATRMCPKRHSTSKIELTVK